MSLADQLPEGFEWPACRSDGADFWRPFWDQSVTPWDLGGPHPALVAAADSLPAGIRVLVPGAGRGHDARFLASLGHRVTAVDFVRQPEAEAELLAAGGSFLVEDALALADTRGPFDLYFEHTFLCALPPDRRADWGALVRRQVAVGGRLWAVVFPCGKALEAGGPPFGIDTRLITDLLGPDFVLEEDLAIASSSPRRPTGERFARFRRREGER